MRTTELGPPCGCVQRGGRFLVEWASKDEIQLELPQPGHRPAQGVVEVQRECFLMHTKVLCGPAVVLASAGGEGSRCSRELLPRKGEREGEQDCGEDTLEADCDYR